MTDAASTRVYLVRHCDVRNPAHILYGHLPDFPLSTRGVAQAHALGRRFAGSPVRVIYTSPLERAQETATIIASYLDGVPVVTTPELVEARFGFYMQGVTLHPSRWRWLEVPLRRPLWLIHMLRPGLLPNDETVAEMSARVRAPLLRILRDHPGEGGICVSHGDPIQAFWVEADNRHPYALHRLQCAKGGYLELDYSGDSLVGKSYHPPSPIDATLGSSPEADTGTL